MPKGNPKGGPGGAATPPGGWLQGAPALEVARATEVDEVGEVTLVLILLLAMAAAAMAAIPAAKK